MSVESKDYPDVHDVEDKSGGHRQKEFDDLLDLAETLQGEYDRVAQRVSFYRVLQGTMVMLGVFAGVILSSITATSSPAFLLYAAVCSLAGGSYAAGIEYIVRKVVVQRNRDRRALSEVVELLRSTERSVAKDEGLSALERAKLKIQLSRFDI